MPLVEVAGAVPAATLEVELQPSDNWYAAFVLAVVEGPTESVECAMESAAFVAEYDRVRRGDGLPRYSVQPAVGMAELLGEYVDDVMELQALATADATIERIRVTSAGWVQSGWFADRETVDEFRSFWERNGRFQLRRLTRAGGTSDPGSELTNPQREALRFAFEMGYFEVPRSASIRKVAAELDITASALSERLRRAQARLVGSTVAGPDPSEL